MLFLNLLTSKYFYSSQHLLPGFSLYIVILSGHLSFPTVTNPHLKVWDKWIRFVLETYVHIPLWAECCIDMTPMLRIVETGSCSKTPKMLTHFAAQKKRDKWLTVVPINIVKHTLVQTHSVPVTFLRYSRLPSSTHPKLLQLIGFPSPSFSSL